MTYVRRPLVALFRDQPFFRDLPDADLAALAGRAVACRFPAGQTLYREGETATRCLLIESGYACLRCHTETGEEYVRNKFSAGSLVGLPVMFMADRRYPATAIAETVLLGYWIDSQTLESLCLTCPGAALEILRYTSDMLRSSLNAHHVLATAHCPQRLAGYLLEQHRLCGSATLAIPLKIGQLAATLGMRSETLSRILAGWRRDGLISGRGPQITLLKPEDLQRLST